MGTSLNNDIHDKANSWQMFNSIAPRYDLLNRLLSLGQDLSWRARLSSLLPSNKPIELLDLATGTADVLIQLASTHPNIYRGIGVDPSEGMLAIGREKIKAKGLSEKLLLQTGNAQQLNFLDNSFDALTISFGIRNVSDLRLGLLEIYRVIKPGGVFMVLEFSKPTNPILAAGHWVYMNAIVPAIGFLFSGNFKAYQYLNKTVASFPYGEQFCLILKQFGFVDIKSYPLMGGVATIYVAHKQG